MTEEMRKSDFADLLGVSRAYVSQLAKANRLVLSASGDVVVRQSLENIAATASADKMGASARAALDRLSRGQPPQAEVSAPAAAPLARVVPSSDPMVVFNTARAANELKRGEQMDIALARDRGELISKDMTVKAVTDLAAATRAAYDRIPDRIATRLAAEKEPAVVYALLQDALDTASATLSKQAGDIINKL